MPVQCLLNIDKPFFQIHYSLLYFGALQVW